MDETQDGYAPSEDRALDQFLLSKPVKLPALLDKVWDTFKYYADEERQDEFIDILRADKFTLNAYFTKDQHGYMMKFNLAGDVFQAVLLAALDTEYIAPLLLYPEHLFILTNSRIPLSDTNLLAMTVIHLGKGYNACSKDVLIPYLTENLMKTTLGLSQQDWSPHRISAATISLLSKLIDHDMFELQDHMITFKCDIDIKQVSLNIIKTIKDVLKFARLQLPPDLLASFDNHSLKYEPTCPPVSRDVLLALALRNLAPAPGAPVPFQHIWKFLSHFFPYLRPQPPWPYEELVQVI